MAGSAMSDFMRRPGSSTRSSRRISSASAPPAMKASRHWLRAAAGTPYWRLVDCRSAPRSSSRTTLALRLADQRPLPPRPISRPAPVALRAPSRGPGIEGFVLDSFQSFYCKSVSDEIVLRGIRPRVVARGNDTAAALGEDRQVFADLAFDVLGRSEGQGDLVVHRAVKDDAVAELGGQSAVVHAAQSAVGAEEFVGGADDGVTGPLKALAAQVGGLAFRGLGPRIGFDVVDGGGVGEGRINRFVVSAEAVQTGQFAGKYAPDAEQGGYLPGIFAGARMAGSKKDALIHAEFDPEGSFVRAV